MVRRLVSHPQQTQRASTLVAFLGFSRRKIMQMLGVAFAYLLTQEKVRKGKGRHKRF
jgi:hypothetical protein